MTGSGDFQIARAPDMAASTKKADRMSAWRTGHRPVFLIFAMPPGAADAADDADGSGQRDNPWSLYRRHGESGPFPAGSCIVVGQAFPPAD